MRRIERLGRVAVVAIVLAGALFMRQLALPGGAAACSCLPREPGAPIFDGGEQAVFIGTARAARADGTFEFVVERWFKGGAAAVVSVQSQLEVFADGTTAINTCGLHFEVGDRLILSAAIDGNVYVPGSCSPHAVVASDDGARLLNEAVQAFGQGTSPGPPVDTPVPDDPDLAGFAMGMVGIVLLVVVIAVVGSARRRREDEGQA